jgi:hypothetical protein
VLALPSTRQLRNLVEVSRFEARARTLEATGASTIGEWVHAFEEHGAIASRHCHP